MNLFLEASFAEKREHEKVQFPPKLQIGISGLSNQEARRPYLEVQVYMLAFSVFISGSKTQQMLHI